MQESVKIDRWRYIGGSDIPIIMELSPFKSRWTLLQEKARLIEDDFLGNKYTEYGQTMEYKIREFINVERGHGFIEGRHYDEERGYRIHTDGEDEVTESVLEIKTTSTIHKSLTEYKIYLVQILFYMAILGYSNGILAVYERPDDLSEELDPDRLQLFPVFLNEHLGLVREIESAVVRFQADVERLKADPFLTESDFLPKDMVALSDSILALENTLDAMKSIEADIKNRKQLLFDLMVENRVKTWATERFRLTRVDEVPAHMETEEYLDLDSLKRDLPELFQSHAYGGYMEERHVKKSGRKGYVKITKLNGGLTDE